MKNNKNEIIDELMKQSDDEKERFYIDPKTDKVIERHDFDNKSEEFQTRARLWKMNLKIESIHNKIK